MSKLSIVSIVGRKNSGKTTLIEKVVKHLTQIGFRVGTIKHTSHDHDFDRPDTDSWRHSKAGSVTTAIISPSRVISYAPRPADEHLSHWINETFIDSDIVICEGNIETLDLMIEIVPTDELPLYEGDKRLEAVVSDVPHPDYRCFGRDEVIGLCDWILHRTELADI